MKLKNKTKQIKTKQYIPLLHETLTHFFTGARPVIPCPTTPPAKPHLQQ